MSYSLILRDVRARFGLHQRELGTWLGVSQSQLARIEADHDALPRHAVCWLLPWLTALNLPPAPVLPLALPVLSPSLPTAEPAAGAGPVPARLAECRYQAQRLGLQLTAQQGQTEVLRARLAIGPYLQAVLPPALPDEPAHAPAALRRRWLARLLEAATDELGPAEEARALLAARRHAWASEAIWLEAYLAAKPPAEGSIAIAA